MTAPLVPRLGGRHPHQRLAAAVLTRAIYDAAGLIERYRYSTAAVRHERIQQEALVWLTTPSVELDFWCEILGIDAETMIDGLDGAIAHAKRRSVMKEV